MLRVFTGVLIIGVGLVTLGERVDLFEPGYSGSGWPLVAVAVGFARLAAPCVDHQGRTDSRRRAGMVWRAAAGRDARCSAPPERTR